MGADSVHLYHVFSLPFLCLCVSTCVHTSKRNHSEQNISLLHPLLSKMTTSKVLLACGQCEGWFFYGISIFPKATEVTEGKELIKTNNTKETDLSCSCSLRNKCLFFNSYFIKEIESDASLIIYQFFVYIFIKTYCNSCIHILHQPRSNSAITQLSHF